MKPRGSSSRLKAPEAVKRSLAEVRLRDEMAGLALVGVLASETEGREFGHINEVAEHCYLIADAMLVARRAIGKDRVFVRRAE
jgi:hypothetical protein